MKKNKKEEINLSEKEKELLKSYQEDDYEEYEEIEEFDVDNEVEEEHPEETFDEYEEVEEKKAKPKKKNTRLLNIIFIVIIVLITMIATDVVSVKKFAKGPFFAIPVKTYKDGGTKVYYGLGYKVIKYNQQQGRRDVVIGPWGMKYNSEVLNAEAIDLAIEFTDDEAAAFKKYNGKFMRITGVLNNVSVNENTITISYIDEDGKYSLNIVCDMASEKKILNDFETDIRITAIGTVYDYHYKSPEEPATLYLKDCFAEQDL